LTSDHLDIPEEILREAVRLYEEGKRLMSCSEYKDAIDSFIEAMRVTFPDSAIWIADRGQVSIRLEVGLKVVPLKAVCSTYICFNQTRSRVESSNGCVVYLWRFWFQSD